MDLGPKRRAKLAEMKADHFARGISKRGYYELLLFPIKTPKVQISFIISKFVTAFSSFCCFSGIRECRQSQNYLRFKIYLL